MRYEMREEIDVEKVAEVLIRIALLQAGQNTPAGRTCGYLRDLLRPSDGIIGSVHDEVFGVAGTQYLSPAVCGVFFSLPDVTAIRRPSRSGNAAALA